MRPDDDIRDMLPLTHLSFLILLSLCGQQRHGYAIIQAVEELSDPPITPRTGTFYSALKRMVEEGTVRPVQTPPPASGQDSRRRYYGITALGRRVLAAEAGRLSSLVHAARALEILPEENA